MFLIPVKRCTQEKSYFVNSMRFLTASMRFNWPAINLSQRGVSASSKSAIKTFAPELRALIIILRSVGPVISTHRFSRSLGAGATRQCGFSRMPFVSGKKSKISLPSWILYQILMWKTVSTMQFVSRKNISNVKQKISFVKLIKNLKARSQRACNNFCLLKLNFRWSAAKNWSASGVKICLTSAVWGPRIVTPIGICCLDSIVIKTHSNSRISFCFEEKLKTNCQRKPNNPREKSRDPMQNNELLGSLLFAVWNSPPNSEQSRKYFSSSLWDSTLPFVFNARQHYCSRTWEKVGDFSLARYVLSYNDQCFIVPFFWLSELKIMWRCEASLHGQRCYSFKTLFKNWIYTCKSGIWEVMAFIENRTVCGNIWCNDRISSCSNGERRSQSLSLWFGTSIIRTKHHIHITAM